MQLLTPSAAVQLAVQTLVWILVHPVERCQPFAAPLAAANWHGLALFTIFPQGQGLEFYFFAPRSGNLYGITV